MKRTHTAAEQELIDLLRRIKARPGLLLGGASFDRLEGFISGYLWRQPREEGAIFDRFGIWLRRHTGIDQEAAYSQFIRFHSITDANAFENFFKNFETFIEDDLEGTYFLDRLPKRAAKG